MTNKEVVDKLQKYFLEQDPKDMARLCANFFLDLNRFYIFDTLNDLEKYHLQWRNKKNMHEVYKFLKKESDSFGDLSFNNVSSEYKEETKGDS